MQSVPNEFTSHLRPLMFVAGLGTGGESATPSTNAGPGDAAKNTLTLSASPGSDGAQSEPSTFSSLYASLRQVFPSKRGFTVYDPNPGRGQASDFHVALVDQNIRFPPRKARLPNNRTGPHSPISPFTPSSPLHPDGLMAPIWVRKHRELVPSVFVLILRLYEFGLLAQEDDQTDRKGREQVEVGPLDKEKMERSKDAEMINEITNRKRLCAERGIKLAVVLLTSRETLDNPALDARLSNIRRQGTLDSRASLFVISPVPETEVRNFINSLKNELYETAVDYYREHGRRLRRKRSRPAKVNNSLASSVVLTAPVAGDAAQGHQDINKGLSTQALNVRYEYKAATFAEFRGETEVALKHYEDCYAALFDLFIHHVNSASNASAGSSGLERQNSSTGSTQGGPVTLLHPRTKRWAEARVLAECLSIKIIKCYLYLNSPVLVMAQHQNHIRCYSRLAREYWSMGEGSFEYWSWVSKQHRLFADLLEAALKAGYKVPALPGPSTSSLQQSRTVPAAALTTQHVPSYVLQHPGFAYYMAALAAVRRRDCFKKAIVDFESLVRQQELQPNPQPFQEPPALRHERSIPHSTHIIELFTHAYEYFKRARSNRITLFLANQIAQVHYADQDWEMARKFDERVARSLRRESWNRLLDSVLLRSVDGTKSASAVPEELGRRSVICLLLERMTLTIAGVHGPSTARRDPLRELVDYLSSTPSSPTTSISVDSAETALPVSWQASFWSASADLGQPVPFQIHLFFPTFAHPAAHGVVQLNSVQVHFTDQREPVLVQAGGSAPFRRMIRIEEAAKAAQARLALDKGFMVLCGAMTSQNPHNLSISKVILAVEIAKHSLSLNIHPLSRKVQQEPRWLLPSQSEDDEAQYLPLSGSEDRSSCRFRARDLRLSFSITCSGPAYLNENFPITLKLANNDTLPTSVSFQIPANSYTAQGALESDTLRIADYEGKDSSVDLAPGEAIERTVNLSSTGHPGARLVDVTIIARPRTSDDADGLPAESRVAVTELTRTARVDVVHPFFCDFRTTYYRSTTVSSQRFATPSKPGKRGLFSLDEPDVWERAWTAMLDLNMGALGPTNVEVLNISLDLASSQGKIRMLQSSLPEGDWQLPCIWEPEDPFSVLYELQISRSFDAGTPAPPGVLEIAWRRPGHSSISKTLVPLPQFILPQPPSEEEDILPIIIASHPSLARLYEPFTAQYRLTFPASAPLYLYSKPRIISFHIESANESFVFSGPKKMERLTVLPSLAAEDGVLLAEYRVVPMGRTGLVPLPRFRAFEVRDTPAMEREERRRFGDGDDGQEGGYAGPRIRELEVVLPGDLLLGKPDDHDVAGVNARSLSVMVVPP